ncbi:MAG: cobaltochelatase subunit CobT [Alphaproteobacteria bacterium]|nr:cobaltochelatase subunit CobT [Alphaproteobacteria bacterium]
MNQSADKTESFKSVTAAVMRTIAGQKELEISFSAAEPPVGRITSGGRPRLPLPDHDMNKNSVQLVRGCADTQALYLAHHNPKIHAKNRPRGMNDTAAYNALEQARVEAIGHKAMNGVAQNLEAVLAEKCRRCGFEHMTAREQAALPDALHVLTRLALTGETPPPAAEKLLSLWQPWLKQQLKKQNLSDLLPLLHDQQAFAELARKLVQALETGKNSEDRESEEESSDDGDERKTQRSEGEADDAGDARADMEQDSDSADGETEGESAMGDMMEDPGGFAEGDMPAGPLRNTYDDELGIHGRYTIYTTQFDEEVGAEDLADPHELSRLRAMLDKQLASHLTVIGKLANRLQRKLMAKQRRTWQFDMEEGILDVAKLARVVANPDVPLTFKQEKETQFRDTVVTLLIDNSGSMRGRPIAIAAMTADIVARTLERCGVKVEILGFTTKAWKGGKARDLWMAQGRPANPGRLNDIRHIIYKAADAPMRRTRRNLGLMLKEGLLKENIDGEALVWAYNRLAQRKEARKILMVISDGAPVDDSTLSVNPANILEQDLRNVIHWIEEKSDVELTAIGIGHDVTRYYKKALTITDADELAKALADQLEDLFDNELGSRS